MFSPFHFYLDAMLYDATHALAHTHAPKHTHTLSQRGEIGTHTDPHLTIYYWSSFAQKSNGDCGKLTGLSSVHEKQKETRGARTVQRVSPIQ